MPNATSIAKSDVYKGRPIEDGEKLHDAKVLRRPWGCNSWSLCSAHLSLAMQRAGFDSNLEFPSEKHLEVCPEVPCCSRFEGVKL